MYLLVSGFRYKNAPLSVREKFSFNREDLPGALKKILEYPSIKEAAILSTCNRTEIYTLVEDTEIATGSIVRFLADYHNLNISEIRKYMFTLMHEDTIRQIFKVTSGVDSMVIGETQITSQVKEAFAAAQEAKTVGKVLTKLFKEALSTGKKVRTQTSLKSVITDISSGGIELARKYSDDFLNNKIAIIGAGQMANLALKYLVAKYEHKNIIVLNRTAKTLENIYLTYNIPAVQFENLQDEIDSIDILFVCTSAPHYIVKPKHMHKDKNLIIVDISVPRNVDPDVANLPNVKLFNTDDVNELIDKESADRAKMLDLAEVIIKEETEKFNNWMMTLDIIPTIIKLREKVENIRLNKIQKLRSKTCPYSDEGCLIMEELSKQLVNTILHDPTVRIKSTQSHEQIFQTAQLLNDLFNLDEVEL